RYRPRRARARRAVAPPMKAYRSSPWARNHRIAVTLFAGVLSAVAGWTIGGKMRPLDVVIYDASLAMADQRPGSRDQPVAVIALDRESLDSQEFAATPRVFLSPSDGHAREGSSYRTDTAAAIRCDMFFPVVQSSKRLSD